MKTVDRLWDDYINQINQAYNQLCSTTEQDIFIKIHDAAGYGGWWKSSIYTGFCEDADPVKIAKNLIINQSFIQNLKLYQFSVFSEKVDGLLEGENKQKKLFSDWWKSNDRSGLIRYKVEQRLKENATPEEIFKFLTDQGIFSGVIL